MAETVKTYKLLGADGKFYQSATKGTLGGHRKDKIYGTLDCVGAARWTAKGHYVKQRVFFADEPTAIAAGFRPCAICLREKYKKWKAKKMKIVTIEFRKTVQDLINNLQAEQFSDAEEYKLSLKHNALPLGVDLWSYVFLTASGAVLWDDNEGEVGSANDLQGLIRALVAGKRLYPQLTEFIPSRPDESKTCPICNGSGINENSKDLRTGEPTKCFLCASLGWITEEAYSEIIKNSK